MSRHRNVGWVEGYRQPLVASLTCVFFSFPWSRCFWGCKGIAVGTNLAVRRNKKDDNRNHNDIFVLIYLIKVTSRLLFIFEFISYWKSTLKLYILELAVNTSALEPMQWALPTGNERVNAMSRTPAGNERVNAMSRLCRHWLCQCNEPSLPAMNVSMQWAIPAGNDCVNAMSRPSGNDCVNAMSRLCRQWSCQCTEPSLPAIIVERLR